MIMRKRNEGVSLASLSNFLSTVPDVVEKATGSDENKWMVECNLPEAPNVKKLHKQRKTREHLLDAIDGLPGTSEESRVPLSPLVSSNINGVSHKAFKRLVGGDIWAMQMRAQSPALASPFKTLRPMSCPPPRDCTSPSSTIENLPTMVNGVSPQTKKHAGASDGDPSPGKVLYVPPRRGVGPAMCGLFAFENSAPTPRRMRRASHA